MSSKADDFDVRYRDTGTAGDVDYDLGYDAEGWDTQGFRRPDVEHLDSHEPGHAGGGGRGPASEQER